MDKWSSSRFHFFRCKRLSWKCLQWKGWFSFEWKVGKVLAFALFNFWLLLSQFVAALWNGWIWVQKSCPRILGVYSSGFWHLVNAIFQCNAGLFYFIQIQFMHLSPGEKHHHCRECVFMIIQQTDMGTKTTPRFKQ